MADLLGYNKIHKIHGIVLFYPWFTLLDTRNATKVQQIYTQDCTKLIQSFWVDRTWAVVSDRDFTVKLLNVAFLRYYNMVEPL